MVKVLVRRVERVINLEAAISLIECSINFKVTSDSNNRRSPHKPASGPTVAGAQDAAPDAASALGVDGPAAASALSHYSVAAPVARAGDTSAGGTSAVDTIARTALGKDRRRRDGRRSEGGSSANRVHADPGVTGGVDAGATAAPAIDAVAAAALAIDAVAAVTGALDPSCAVGANATYGGAAAAGGVDAGARSALGKDRHR